jgi:NitT/TauT family transport system substrate-binding protein
VADDAALYLAQQRHLFAAQKVDVSVQTLKQSTLAVPGMLRGEIDIDAGGNYVSFFQAHDKGTLKIRIIAEACRSAHGYFSCLAMPGSAVRTAAELPGRKVAVNLLNNVQTLTLNALVRAAGGDPAKVHYVQIPFPQMAAALQRGQVDAASLVEPFVTDARSTLGARVVVDQGTGPVADLPLSGYFSTASFASEQPATVAAFKKAITAAQRIASTDRSAVERILPTYTQISAATAAKISLGDYPAAPDAAKLQKVADLMLSQGLLSKHLDVSALLV